MVDLAVERARRARLGEIQRHVLRIVRKAYVPWELPKIDVAHQLRTCSKWELMQDGPYLVDRVVVVVPSEWKNPRAIRFWKRAGFRWNGRALSWIRDTREPHEDKVYEPETWLRSIRERFYDFWPELEERNGR